MAIDFSDWYATLNAALIDSYRPGGYMPDGSFALYPLNGVRSIQIPVNTPQVAGNIADISTELTPNSETPADIDLQADDPIKAQRWIGKDQIAYIGLPLAQEYGGYLAKDIMQGEAHRMAALMGAHVIDTAAQQVSYDGLDLTADEAADAFSEGVQKLAEADAPYDSRYAILKPSLFRKLSRSTYAGSRDYNSANDNARRQNTLLVDGVLCIESTSIFGLNWSTPGSNNAPVGLPSKYQKNFLTFGLEGIIWDAGAIALGRAADPELEKDYHLNYGGWQFVARSHFGSAIRYGTGVVGLVNSGS